jgi:hypothetical protein
VVGDGKTEDSITLIGKFAGGFAQLAIGLGGAHDVCMAKSKVRLLEVNVAAIEPTRWKWMVFEGEIEIACGFEPSRETAQIAGDSALFALLSIARL